MDTFARPSGKNATPTLKRAVWDMHVGPGVQQTLCALCGINKIYQNQNNGSDLAHIVARKFFTEELSIFYLIPSCKSCNSECENLCVLDFLWVRGRVTPLRRLIMVIYQAFVAHHQDELAHCDRQAWRVLEHLYGPSRFPLGGGVQNTKAIYEIARTEQYAALVAEAAELARQQQALSTLMRALMEAEIKPMKFGFYILSHPYPCSARIPGCSALCPLSNPQNARPKSFSDKYQGSPASWVGDRLSELPGVRKAREDRRRAASFP